MVRHQLASSAKHALALMCAAALALCVALALSPSPAQAADFSKYSTGTIAWGLGVNTSHKTPSGEASIGTLAKFDAYYVGNTSRANKRIYLTFDCGYENGNTTAILNTLKKTGVKAAFFVTADFINSAPKLVKRMKREGHLVGNHTVHHPHMAQMSPSAIKAELRNNEKLMKRKTGYVVDKFWRPPYGEASKRTMKVAQSLGYTTIFWSMAYYDYDPADQPGKDFVVNYFKRHHHPGAITLTHNVSSSNRKALKTVIRNLKKEGYAFASLTELGLKAPGKARLRSVASEEPGALKVKVKKLKRADVYELQIARNAKFTKGVTSIDTFKTTGVFKGLKQGGKYYVRARGYAQGDTGNLYGAWSKKKKVTVLRQEANANG